MVLIGRWFSRAAERMENARFIEEALLTRRYARYAFFRLRFFLGISFAEALVHIIEFTILAFIFTRHSLVLAILVRTIGTLCSAWWWGALEEMRAEIRSLRREGKSHRIDSVASRWISLAVIVSVLVLTAAFGWIVIDTARPTRVFTIFHLFVWAVAVQLAVSVLSRTYHSIVYAVRRVYRPFTAILCVRLFAFIGTLVVWPLLNYWSFPVMLQATSILGGALTFHYVRRMYRSLGFGPLHLMPGRGALRLLRLLVRRRVWLAGFAYVALRLDALISLMLFAHASHNPDDYNLLVFFYLISPLVHSTYGWAQLFYFDLTRLEQGILFNLRADFERFVRRLAWWMGGLFSVAACITGTLLTGRNLGLLYLLLVLFFVFRAQLAFLQIRFFTERRYGELIFFGAVLITTVLYAQLAIPGQTQRFGFYGAALTLVMLCMTPVALRTFGRQSRRGIVSLPDWIASVSAIRNPLRIRSAFFARNANAVQTADVIHRIEQAVRSVGHVTRMGRGQVTWFERGEDDGILLDKSVMIWAGGLIRALKQTDVEATGMDALARAQQLGIIADGVPVQPGVGSETHDISRLLSDFRRMFPDGVSLDLQQHSDEATAAFSPAQCRDVMFNAMQYSRDFSPSQRSSDFDVSTLLVDGEIRIIFAIPMRIVARARRRWREAINKVNLAIACGVEARG